MSERFSELFEQEQQAKIFPGMILTGKVVNILRNYVVVSSGLKSDSLISIDQFKNKVGNLEIAVGDDVDVALDDIEDGFGETRLSRERAKRAETWTMLEKAHTDQKNIIGMISGKVKGGFTVDIDGIRAFLPGSLVDVRTARDSAPMEGQELEFRVIKIDKKRNNIVVSRRSVMDTENNEERTQLLSQLTEGMEIHGVVKNLTDYGAFVDLGGIDGLLHITDMAWRRVKHPSEVLTVGDSILVKILKFDRERSRVSLGLKQLGADPWSELGSKYAVGTRIVGRVSNITDYGCFIELENGVEGLVHVSEMDWTNKNIHPSKVIQIDQEVEVMVLEIDIERRRISLGIKQCRQNPWLHFAEKYEKGTEITGTIKSITDFGIFLGLEGNIDGLIHLSDLSWHESGDEAVRRYRKGQEITAMVLAVDSERERISLGIKQLENDPMSAFHTRFPKGSIVVGQVIEIQPKFATIQLEPDVFGILKSQDASRDRIEDLTRVMRIGDEVEAKIMGIDKKTRFFSLSIKAKDYADNQQSLQDLQQEHSDKNTAIGDLLRSHMENQEDE